jgi:hypothetical protein
MARRLAIAGLILDVVSGVLLSLGVLTPELVRKIGIRVASNIFWKPESAVLRAAHFGVFQPKPDRIFEAVDKCLVELAVSLITSVIASALAIILLFGLSLRMLVMTASQAVADPLSLGISIAGLLVCAGGLCTFLTVEPSRAHKPIAKVLRLMLEVIAKAWNVASPLVWVLSRLISLFSVTLPRLWYYTLQKIHAQGMEWSITLLGLALAAFSFVLQMWAVLVVP